MPDVCTNFIKCPWMSENTPWFSNPSSNELYVSYVIEKSWLIQESTCFKHYLFSDTDLVISDYYYYQDNDTYQYRLNVIGISETGLLF